MIVEIFHNIAVLIAICVVYNLVFIKWDYHSNVGRLLLGLVFGLAIALGMLMPFRFSPGLIFDGRSVLVSLAGLFGGIIPATIAAIIGVIARAYIGGVGTFLGCGLIVTSAALGVGCHFWWRRKKRFFQRISG